MISARCLVFGYLDPLGRLFLLHSALRTPHEIPGAEVAIGLSTYVCGCLDRAGTEPFVWDTTVQTSKQS